MTLTQFQTMMDTITPIAEMESGEVKTEKPISGKLAADMLIAQFGIKEVKQDG